MTTFIIAVIVVICLSMIAVIYRMVKGPSASDRVVALDSLGVSLISLIGLFSILVETSFFLEIILLLAILSFIGTMAFSKFIEKGDIIKRDNSR
ncbi:Na(+)/H(+) antiporter subunit F1 [Lysinibacillus sp. HST-98]|jgi:multicomponent Na+:H+ antiporter subunit F|uniref:Monovalent cation/H+ antiporter subunit F n=3 Tax=Lysinibacillus TaxID=400634 RepID=A0A2X0XEC3_9BACI|nr:MULTISPECIES: Na(+)/H(+) antiporter subunit F1 [Lysinibacillus]EFI68920.1 efflux system protein [Lysinibacillus fusiformis ZC1]EKU41918.1 efflux system protein [Lysinibacillus fusiformis ZB2]AUS88086.1 Na(+)/H(+) antiporter subunit F [Lysinibacillus sp. YS11]KGR83535.1 monovalent cation/H+ antiporter subunit F [Lysinibacillus boronitolerans JCM 21713 = 10a = NBRC 103108]KMN38672.1 monovalent cation/H+ antiporter subunit F [Lysinibacillus sp. LK3]